MNEPFVSVNNTDSEFCVIDHITADFMRVLYKLDLAEKFYVTNLYEKIWDVDELREVNDHIGYQVHWTE